VIDDTIINVRNTNKGEMNMSKQYQFQYTIKGNITIVADNVEEAEEKVNDYISEQVIEHKTHWGFDDGSKFDDDANYEVRFQKES
jgi:hypothetical protein